MRRSSLIVVPLVAIAAGTGLAMSPSDAGVEEGRFIRTHLTMVSRALHASTPSSLTAEQRKARATTLRWLDEYRDRSVFPHNHVVEGRRVPVFVDPHGTPCAVGYLMLRSGEDELVEEIVRTDNLIRVLELRDDPRVVSWLASRGITLEEATWIQPSYGPGDPYEVVRDPDEGWSGHEVATVGASIVTAALASYTAAVGRGAGTPWVDGLSLGTTIGHVYLLAADDEEYQSGWETWLNVGGLATSLGTMIARMAHRSGRADADADPEGLATFVRPGMNGTELGLVFRH